MTEITAWSTLVLAVVTILYAFLTWRILTASGKSIALTQEIFEKSHRPYIVIESVDLIKGADDAIVLKPTLYNCGPVPADILEVGADFESITNFQVISPRLKLSIPPLTRNSSIVFRISAAEDDLSARIALDLFQKAASFDTWEWKSTVTIRFCGVSNTRYKSSASFDKASGQRQAALTSSEFS